MSNAMWGQWIQWFVKRGCQMGAFDDWEELIMN